MIVVREQSEISERVSRAKRLYATLLLSSKILLLNAFFLLIVGSSTPLRSQETEESNGAATPGRLQIEESPLDTVYLKRQDGTFVPYFNIPFEVFESLYEQYVGGQGDALPEAYTVQRMGIEGKVQADPREELANLKIRLRIQPNREGWVRVPLRLGGSTLTGWSKSKPDDTILISLDRSNEYVAWIRSAEDQAIEVELDVVARVARQANQRLLRLALPTTAVSQLSLELPTNQLDVTFSSEKLLPETRPLSGGRTSLSVAGVSGDVELRYRAPVISSASGLSVVNEMTVQVDGPDLIRYQASLNVTSLNGQDRSFIVRLPTGTRFDATEQLELDILQLEPDDPILADLDPNFAYLRVAFPNPLEKPTRVVLFASRSDDVFLPGTESRYEIDLGGFEVVDAVRQSGTILLLSSRDWRLDWEPGRFVRQVSLDDTDRDRPNATARFRFSRTPIQLQAELYQNVSRTACEPTYSVVIGEAQIQLACQFKYTFSGPRPTTVLVDSRGWDLNEAQFGVANLVRQVTLDPNLPGRFRLELDASLPDEAFDLSLELTRPIEDSGEDVAIPLPAPVVSTLSPAVTTVRTISNLELVLPISTATEDLQPIDVANPPASEESAVTVRLGDLNAVSELYCDVRPRQQRKTVVSTIDVVSNQPDWRVQQNLNYRVEFSPMRTGYLAVPAAVVALPSFELRLEDQPLRSQVLPGEVDSFGETLQLVQFELPQPLTGAFEIQSRFLWPAVVSDSENERQTLNIPVVTPVQTLDTGLLPIGDPFAGPLAGLSVFPLGDLAQTVGIRMPRSMSILSNSNRWELEEKPDAGTERNYLLTKLDQQTVQAVEMTLGSKRETLSVGSTRVGGAWVQSRVTPQFRSERVAFQVETRDPRIQISLPPNAEFTELAVDGVRQLDAVDRLNGEQLEVEFDDLVRRSSHTVELWYRFPRSRQNDRRLDFAMPKLASTDWVDQVYWEVVLPSDELMILGPGTLVSENELKWKGPWMLSQASVSASWLEEWVGVEHQTQASSKSHRYVYSGFGQGLEAKIWTAKCWEILGVVCGSIFLSGMLLVHLSWLRRPVVMLLFGCGVMGLGLTLEPIGQLFVQLVVFSGVFVGLSLFLRKLWPEPEVRLSVRAVAPQAKAAVASTEQELDPDSVDRPHVTEEVGSTQTAGELAT